MADNEYIKRSDVIGIIEDKIKRCETIPGAFVCASLRTAVMGLRSADVAPRSEWISVEERLPDNCRAVLVALEGLTIGGAPAMAIGSYSGGFWMVADADGTHYLTKYMRYKVTHWMPRPEPPKGEKHDPDPA